MRFFDRSRHPARHSVAPAAPEPVSPVPIRMPRPAPLGVAFTDVCFLHWPVEPALVSPHLPAGTRPDIFDGRTYVGLVAFRMRSFGEFLETNVRVYSVDGAGRRGTVFLTMEANRLPWVLAARAAAMPYTWSRMGLTRDVHVLTYDTVRNWPRPRGVRNRIRIRVGAPTEPTALEHFLTARWRLHLSSYGHAVGIPLAHDRWPLHTAELLDLDDELIANTGLPGPSDEPASVLYSPAVYGRFGLPQSI